MTDRKRLPNEDRVIPFVLAPDKYCPRKLTNLPELPNVKRYLSAPKPLLGYMIACPACGFPEMHMHAAAAFVEKDDVLQASDADVTCINCQRAVRVRRTDDGQTVIEARRS